jgi:hypothetical protein
VAAWAESMVAARSAEVEAGVVWQLESFRFGVKLRGENGGGREEGGGNKKGTGFSGTRVFSSPVFLRVGCAWTGTRRD